MLELIVIVFLGVASVVILLMSATGGSTSRLSKERIKVLQSVLLQGRRTQENDIEVSDLRKTEDLSSIPWLNRLLLRFEVVPRLRLLLYQANIRWTASLLLLLTGAFFIVPFYLIGLITGMFGAGLLAGSILAFAPWIYEA
jgi:tight adherence protein B